MKFLNKSRKSESKSEGSGANSRNDNMADKEDLGPTVSPVKSSSTEDTQASSDKFSMMFSQRIKEIGGTQKGNEEGLDFLQNPDLNINPSILNSKTAPSLLTLSSTRMTESIFSRGNLSLSTKESSYASTSQRSKKKGSYEYRNRGDIGQALQIVDIPEEPIEITNMHEYISDKLHNLSSDISFILNQYHNSLINLSTAVIDTIECLKQFISSVLKFEDLGEQEWDFNTYNNEHLRKIMCIYLDFYDNLLADDVYLKLKVMLVKNFDDFTKVLSSDLKRARLISSSVSKPQNFAIGVNDGKSLPNEDVLARVIRRVSTSGMLISEQTGTFIAPIYRGISKNLNILCLYFGIPSPKTYHYEMARSIGELYDDIHVMVVKNYIDLCSTVNKAAKDDMKTTSGQGYISYEKVSPMFKFKLPFRIPRDQTNPPISISLSTENSLRISGTLGGYIYPKINVAKQPHLESYTDSKFAISCGHVCLNNNDKNLNYPYVASPSAVLISLYKQALTAQYKKVSEGEAENLANEAKVAYGAALKQIDEMFPFKKVKVLGSNEDKYEIRNLPKHRFGQIIWGERMLIALSNEDGKEDVEKKLSDLAIIKVNKNLKCNLNFLGDDVAFNEYDPALMFDNLYVRGIVNLHRSSDIRLDEVDDSATENDNCNGLPVFKYGSTTKLTKGNLNGIKLVYWLDGAIQSSEFVVGSVDSNTAFAAGGDSGSWILTKLENFKNSTPAKGLGVVGMLHSHDGEQKQFGLFTPMMEILERLEKVTGIEWGVVGVPEKDVQLSNEENDSIYSGIFENESFESEKSSLSSFKDSVGNESLDE